jgi:transcriptional regulator with XRE-family HTH domain
MNRHVSVSTRRVETGTLYFVALLREELGRRIATARLAAGLSQRELADLIGLKNASDVSRYERGTVEVPSARIDLIAEATKRPRSFFTRDPSEVDLPLDEDRELAALREEVAEVRSMVAELLERSA